MCACRSPDESRGLRRVARDDPDVANRVQDGGDPTVPIVEGPYASPVETRLDVRLRAIGDDEIGPEGEDALGVRVDERAHAGKPCVPPAGTHRRC